MDQANSIAIRRLGPADAAIWRAIRLEALKAAPEAFGQSYEHAAAQPIEHFQRGVSGTHPIFAAFAGASAVGTAGFYVMDGPKVAHRGMLWGMYVAPSHRGTGLARRLIETVIQYAEAQVEQIHLHVVTVNATAYSLYRKMGFVPYGIEPRALRYDGRDYDETLMVRMLDRPTQR